MVRLHKTLRVVGAALWGEVVAVYSVAAVGRQGHAIAGLIVARTWLGELTSHATHLDDRKRRTVHEDNCHLKQSLDAVANAVCGCIREGLSAVATLKQECLARSCLTEAVA